MILNLFFIQIKRLTPTNLNFSFKETINVIKYLIYKNYIHAPSVISL